MGWGKHNKATVKKLADIILRYVQEQDAVALNGPRLKRRNKIKGKEVTLGPRGSRPVQYQLIKSLYAIFLSTEELGAGPEDASGESLTESELIRTLMSKAFDRVYGTKVRSKRQRLYVWANVLQWLWAIDAEADNADFQIFQIGGIEKAAEQWAVVKKARGYD